MIDLYASTTPNVLKVEIMLEETGLPYGLKPVNVWKGEQFAPDFVALNPNSKVPVIVDHDVPGGYAVFESGAILFYLAEKTGQLLPASGAARYDVMKWLVFQVANLGPMNGQFNHFDLYAGPGNHDYSLSRYTTELKRQYGVMERRLGEVPYLGGDAFSIADVAVFPWVLVQSNRLREKYPFLDKESPLYPNIAAWVKRCEARPGVQRGLTAHSALKSGLPTATPDDLDRIFGRGKYAYKG